ncbi:MAG TPA: septal ring lytic transglycosylase RlpA family protein [Rubricoccaceae bacterium]|nr:septal ring lytic transglycosylase RlpA family protein [Rubricoccaceae bacterium]
MRDRFFRALLLALALGLAAEAVSAQPRTGLYVVQPGDTLYRIATRHNLTVEQLKRLNRLETDEIEVGWTLRLTTLVPLPNRTASRPPANIPERPPPDPTPPDRPAPDKPPPDRPAPDRPEDPEAPPIRIATALTPAPLSTDRPAAPASTGTETIHVVRAGETLFAIAVRYGTTVDAIRRLNNVRGDRIEIGQRLVVARGTTPGTPTAVAPERPWRMNDTTIPADVVHFVSPGETLYSIAARYGLEVRALIAANPGLTTAPLVPGEMLFFPTPVDLSALPEDPLPPLDTTGLALVFPAALDGRPTANGERYRHEALTASHRTLPFNTVLLVTNPANGRSTFVRINDRGPVSAGYLLELSGAAAEALDLDPNAARRVELRQLPSAR